MHIPETHASRQEARLKYLPNPIKAILVAEAPPEAEDRFFYYPDVKEYDWLFWGMMEVLYNQKRQPLAEVKLRLLERFQDDGYYLMDTSETPLPSELKNKKRVRALKPAVPGLIIRLKEVGALERSIPIILIKATVYEAAYKILEQEGFNVVNTNKIAFPSSGQQENFRREFDKIIQQLR
ncbi:MAG: hypothetical protein U0350_49355 [Caldilineaceae bacterium]